MIALMILVFLDSAVIAACLRASSRPRHVDRHGRAPLEELKIHRLFVILPWNNFYGPV